MVLGKQVPAAELGFRASHEELQCHPASHTGKPVTEALVFCREKVLLQGGWTRRQEAAQMCLPKLRWSTEFIQKVYAYAAEAGVISKAGEGFYVPAKHVDVLVHTLYVQKVASQPHCGGDCSVVRKER